MPADSKVLLIAYYYEDARRFVIILPCFFYDPITTFWTIQWAESTYSELLKHILKNGDPSWKTQEMKISEEKVRYLTRAT